MSIQEIINESSNTVLQCAVSAGIGYLAARLFTLINPVHAALNAAIVVLVAKAIDPFFKKIFSGPGANDASKFVGTVLNFTVSVGASLTIGSLLGAPMPFGAFLGTSVAGSVTVGIIMVSIVAFCILGIAFDYSWRTIIGN